MSQKQHEPAAAAGGAGAGPGARPALSARDAAKAALARLQAVDAADQQRREQDKPRETVRRPQTVGQFVESLLGGGSCCRRY